MGKRRGRPGGNPDLAQHQFTTERDEPCTERIQIRLPKSLYERITANPNWPDWARRILTENLEDSV
jgi:hypothetical protein